MTISERNETRLLLSKHKALDELADRVTAIHRMVALVEAAHDAVMAATSKAEVREAMRSVVVPQ